MDYRRLGRSGLIVPALSLGTGTFGGTGPLFGNWGTTDAREAERMVDICLEAGANLFDSADVYSQGAAETVLGAAIRGRRGRVLISTKIGLPMGDGPDQAGTSGRRVLAATEDALRRLETDRIDLLQLHAFDVSTPIEEVLQALGELVRAGKVRHVGVSNFSGWQLMKSLAAADRDGVPRYVAHQVYYSLVGRDYEWELMPLALDQGDETRKNQLPAWRRAWVFLKLLMMWPVVNQVTDDGLRLGSRINTIGRLRLPPSAFRKVEVLIASITKSCSRAAMRWLSLSRPDAIQIMQSKKFLQK